YANIAAGRDLHDSIRDLAAKLIASGMKAGAAINQLRALMDASSAPKDERWLARKGEIPAAVDSAVAKYGKRPNASGTPESGPGVSEPEPEEPEKPEPEPEPEPKQKPEPQKYRFQLKPFSTVAVSTGRNYLAKGILPRVGLAVVWGPPKCGKSF